MLSTPILNVLLSCTIVCRKCLSPKAKTFLFPSKNKKYLDRNSPEATLERRRVRTQTPTHPSHMPNTQTPNPHLRHNRNSFLPKPQLTRTKIWRWSQLCKSLPPPICSGRNLLLRYWVKGSSTKKAAEELAQYKVSWRYKMRRIWIGPDQIGTKLHYSF